MGNKNEMRREIGRELECCAVEESQLSFFGLGNGYTKYLQWKGDQKEKKKKKWRFCVEFSFS